MPVKQCLDQAIETAIQDKRQQELAKLGKSLRQDEREIRSLYEQLMEADKNVYFGSKEYAAMKRSTNGGGENSPILAGADDLYEDFFAPLNNLEGE